MQRARPRRVTIAFDVYAPEPENARTSTANSDRACVTALRFLTRRSCEVTLPRGDAVTWDFTAPAEGTVISAVVDPRRLTRTSFPRSKSWTAAGPQTSLSQRHFITVGSGIDSEAWRLAPGNMKVTIEAGKRVVPLQRYRSAPGTSFVD